GIISRVRELKQALDISFYHPGVLATIAPYNAAFGRKFHELFEAAATEIRSFARALEEQGGSILGTVEGVDVTVEHVAALKESDLLRIDYGSALEKFRRLSHLKKPLDRRPPIRWTPRPTVVPAKTGSAASSGKPGRMDAPRLTLDVSALRAAVTPQQIATEESKLLRIEESIRVFVRVA